MGSGVRHERVRPAASPERQICFARFALHRNSIGKRLGAFIEADLHLNSCVFLKHRHQWFDEFGASTRVDHQGLRR